MSISSLRSRLPFGIEFSIAMALFVTLFLIAPNAHAAESICPGGSNPRGDITWCADFENLSNCVTGQEEQCWQGNGFVQQLPGQSNPYGWKIVTGLAAVGQGFATASAQPGGSGGGFAYTNDLPGSPYTAVNYRWYMRFSKGYMSQASFRDHGAAVLGRGVIPPGQVYPCGATVMLEHAPVGYHFAVNTACPVASNSLRSSQNLKYR